MLILYTKDGCQPCEKVKRTFTERKITYEERNIKNPEYLKEAQERGVRAVPFLVDTSANISMGESDDIIDYASEYSF